MAAPALKDGKHIQSDLEAISKREGSTTTSDKIEAFLDQLDESEEALWKLTHEKDEQRFPDPIFNCELVQSFREAGYFVYRLRPLRALGQYRILYAYDGVKEEITLLAIVRKRPPGEQFVGDDSYYEYEPVHPISVRIRDEYDELGFPKYH